MKKLFVLLALLSTTSSYAIAADKVILSCSSVSEQSPVSLDIQVTQDADGIYHYTASSCTLVSHGCAGNGGSHCDTSSGEIKKIADNSNNFAIQGVTIGPTCGHQMAFDDPTKGIQFDISLSNCTYGN
jgi:hypothetical protein